MRRFDVDKSAFGVGDVDQPRVAVVVHDDGLADAYPFQERDFLVAVLTIGSCSRR